jgi:poly-gamma-glutamate synthesis protein (capsule biosynthesis protein)
MRYPPVGRAFPLALGCALSLTSPLVATSQPAHPQRDGAGEITLVLAGDAILNRKLRVYDEPEFLGLRDLVRGATAAFVNLETLFHRYEPEIMPASESGGTYMQSDPEIARELVWMGFDLLNMANNHTGDYGIAGLRSTTRAVEAVGLVHAGTGENLALARAPAYLDTPRGRVALVAAASTFPDASRAGAQRKDMRGRPGLAPMRFETVYQVTPGQLEALHLYREGTGARRGTGDRLRLFNQIFQVGDSYRVLTTPHQGDLAEIEASVREASRQADFVVFSGHSHESAGTSTVPADFIRTVAHTVIDAGADVYVGHGPHVLRGIELYNGGIIFYSLGDLVFQNETVALQPADNYDNYDLGPQAVAADFYDARTSFVNNPLVWESVVARVTFRDGKLAAVELHPITLGHGLPRAQRGRPLLAGGETAARIIGDLRRLSEPLGTEVRLERGIGVVAVR